MNNQVRNGEIEIDLLHLVKLLWSKVGIILLSMLLLGAILLSYAIFFVPPQYQSTAMMYVNNSSIEAGSTSLSITSSELSAAKTLLDLYIVILKSRVTLEKVIEQAELDYTYDQLCERITAGSVNETEIFRITVTSTDPAEAEKIADTIVAILPDRIAEIVAGSSVRLVDHAVRATERSAPSYIRFAALGMLAGLILSCGVIIVLDLMDTTVRSEEYLIQNYADLPLLAVVPDVNSAKKRFCGYGYYQDDRSASANVKEKEKYKKRENAVLSAEDLKYTLGSGRPFAMAEAHKRLRTNVFFRFEDNSGCRVIGVTSAIAHEGKSTTSVNLAYDILQAGKKVLFIDANMRLSRIANTLSLNFAPGLSDVLVGENDGENPVQYAAQMKNLPIITCGEIPPNPTELLASKRMEVLLETLKKNYEYIIIDLPPVSAVADALIVSRLADGILVVVRQDHVDKKLLDDTVNQLKFNDARIIGLVMNGARAESRYYK